MVGGSCGLLMFAFALGCCLCWVLWLVGFALLLWLGMMVFCGCSLFRRVGLRLLL